MFGCGANVVAPIGGTIEETRTIDPWVPKTDDPATRGGKYVSMVGDDGVRYYFAHLASVAVQPGDVVDRRRLARRDGPDGQRPKVGVPHSLRNLVAVRRDEWAVRRGEIWPWKYLDAWRAGEQLSPVDEITTAEAANPDACNLRDPRSGRGLTHSVDAVAGPASMARAGSDD